MRLLVQKILAVLARLTLWRYRPKVVAITGSVGKTSTKEAIACVLKSKFEVRQSLSNYNNEIGLPLTIIGEQSFGRNIFGWILVLIKAVLKLIFIQYPQVLVLEIGVDRPGDIEYLINILGNIDAAVVTDIGVSHLEFFIHQTDLAKEKLTLIKRLKASATAILNFDSSKIFEGRNQTRARVIGFGFESLAQLEATDFQLIQSAGRWGVTFKVHHEGTVVPFFLPNALGKPAVYAALAAAGAGLHFNINLVESSQALKTYQPPAGRLRVIEGIKRTTILDDTYNAAPASSVAALEVLNQIANGRKVAVLGSMAELGSKTDSGHREVALKIIETRIDVVFLVGEQAKIIKDELERRKYWGRVFWFATADDARMPIQEKILENDTILVKGSQSARMEKIVKEIMAEPLKAPKLLVRQSEKWINQP